ncbi:hypothetical protein ACLOJK_007847 [Asimina triloba]
MGTPGSSSSTDCPPWELDVSFLEGWPNLGKESDTVGGMRFCTKEGLITLAGITVPRQVQGLGQNGYSKDRAMGLIDRESLATSVRMIVP